MSQSPANESAVVKNKTTNKNKGSGKRIYLNVPYKEKEGVKKYGGRWDKDERKWYIMDSISELDKHFVMEKWGN